MVLDWETWRKARLNERGRLGFEKRPLPCRSWKQIRAASIAEVTWPYTPDELAAIRELLPEKHREIALQHAVRAAQLYVFAQTRGKVSNANPRKEIERLRSAFVELFHALMHLRPEARSYLTENMVDMRLPDEQPFTVESLRHAIDRFDRENRRGLEQLPDAIRGGARPRMHEKRLDQRLQEAFIIGHGGKRPKQGFPAFQDACLVALKDFGLLPRSSKALQDANRKRGKNITKNR
ncbi:MAG: hypothetical protein ACXU89_09330 [Xanthobacteraceae bacterium]